MDGECFPVEDLSGPDRALADSVLTFGLENEALFTLAGGLKPMSTLRHDRLALARDPQMDAGVRGAVDPEHPDVRRSAQLTRVVDHLTCGPVQAIILPFRATQDSVRTLQTVVVHRERMDDILRDQPEFWGQWGLRPGADPAVVVTVVEFEATRARHRGYGALFGYPEHAVSFFVEAGLTQETTGEFVERDFFQVPVHAADEGRFVYAVPRGHDARPEDEQILASAADILARFRAVRERYVEGDGTLRPVELLRDWYAGVSTAGSGQRPSHGVDAPSGHAGSHDVFRDRPDLQLRESATHMQPLDPLQGRVEDWKAAGGRGELPLPGQPLQP